MNDVIARKLLAPAIFLCGLVSCSQPPAETEPGVSLELARHRAEVVSQPSYRLEFSIPEQPDQDIAGRARILFDLSDTSVPLQIDFRESSNNVLGVVSNGTASDFQFADEHIVIPASELVLGSNEIDIEFIAGSTSLNRNPEYLYTLFVPDRARTAFPLFDQPDLKASFELSLTVPRSWKAMSNAAVASIRESENTTEYRFFPSDLIPSYLFSFVAGKFDAVTQERDGRSMTLFHRETDAEKVARNLDDIFDLHAAAIEWLETYTGIDYPFQKFDFALIPSFQYGGMEHVGAIQYRASALLLDESPSDTQLLRRAGLIAHETAHTWFGNLVTMEWFNDVWTKEVFANFMAAKIVNPGFPDINHDLNFLVRHYPSAYSIDRTSGSNPIRQELLNLNEAGQMYGAIIYNKAPIMMRQLELMIGEALFREGMREYLARFSFANATWPALIDILDTKTAVDLRAWSEIWVNTAGRPEMEEQWETTTEREGGHHLIQHDPAGMERVWPQQFEIAVSANDAIARFPIASTSMATSLGNMRGADDEAVIFNSDGRGYGLFPSSISNLARWDDLDDVAKGSELINLYENLLAGSGPSPDAYFLALQDIAASEQNQLLLDLVLDQLATIYWNLLADEKQEELAEALEEILWQTMLEQADSSRTKLYFDAFADIAVSQVAVQRVYEAWSGALTIDNLKWSENDYIDVAQLLAIKLQDDAEKIVNTQLARIENPDNQRRFRYLVPSLSPAEVVRDSFFFSLAEEMNRETESWVLEALENLHHPLRRAQSEKYLRASLELLQEIQVTGDIFFPTNWLAANLANHRSISAVNTIYTFLEERPDYNAQLKMKILQEADPVFRAYVIVEADRPE